MFEGLLRLVGIEPMVGGAVVPSPKAEERFLNARHDRLTADWRPYNQSASQELRWALRTLRARARQAAQDDDYFKKYLNLCVENVIGPRGIRMRPRIEGGGSETINKKRKEAIEREWREFCRPENLSVCGTVDLIDLLTIALRTILTDGECVFWIRYTGKYGMQLQFVDPDYLDENWSNFEYAGSQSVKNPIIMSVEKDVYGKPLAYWLSPPAGQLDAFNLLSTSRLRVPAEEMMHLFEPYRGNSSRGVPSAHTVLKRMHDLARFEEATIVNERVSAAKMMFIQKDVASMDEDELTDEDIIQNVEPGTVEILPAGYTAKEFDPKGVTTGLEEFRREFLKAIAAGLGVSYGALAQDQNNTSYSTLRAFLLADQNFYKMKQGFLIRKLLRPIFERFLLLNLPTIGIPVRAFDSCKYPAFTAQGFVSIDPSKDSNADKTDLENRVKSRSQIIEGRGEDPEEVFEQIEKENERFMEIDRAKMEMDAAAKAAANPNADPNADPNAGGESANQAKDNAVEGDDENDD